VTAPGGGVPRREVLCGDGVAFLRRGGLPADQAVVTSLPDASELPALGFEGWREWFVETSALACAAVADEAVAVFFQTDVKRDGRWIDKAHLVLTGADRAGAHLLWHKVVCRAPWPGPRSSRRGAGARRARSGRAAAAARARGRAGGRRRGGRRW